VNPHLVRELVKGGKPSCDCAKDVRRRHGPYWYFRFEEFDRRTGQTRYRRALERISSAILWRDGSGGPRPPAAVGERS